MLEPAARAMSTSSVASLTSVAPHFLRISLPPPKVAVPRMRAGIFSPDPPSVRYSMSLSLEGIQRYHRLAAAKTSARSGAQSAFVGLSSADFRHWHFSNLAP